MKKILIVEDEKSLAKILEHKLLSSGFYAEVVFDGENALEKLNENHYDLMLLDLILPKVDGFGVLETMKKKKIKCKVIVLSNLSQTEDIDRVKQLGVIDYLVKSDIPLIDVVEEVRKRIDTID